METPITTGTVVAFGLSVVLAYAAPQTKPASAGAPPGAAAVGIGADRGQQTTTITGCLRQGATPRSYVLTQSPGTSVPHGGVGTAAARDQHGTRYDLIADSKTDLSKMVGRQVEVTGMATIGPVNPGGNDKNLARQRTGDEPTVGGGTGERERSPADAALSRFNVKSIKQTGTSC